MSKGFKSRAIQTAALSLALIGYFSTQTSTACKPPLKPECPKITISCPDEQPEIGKTYTVSVKVEGVESKERLTYHWSFSSEGGEIVDGQGTASIKVLVKYTYSTMTAYSPGETWL